MTPLPPTDTLVADLRFQVITDEPGARARNTVGQHVAEHVLAGLLLTDPGATAQAGHALVQTCAALARASVTFDNGRPAPPLPPRRRPRRRHRLRRPRPHRPRTGGHGMTAVIEVPRGEVRAALAAVLPHSGRATDDTPDLGRVRFVAAGDALLVWCTDHKTSGLARVEHPEYSDGDLPSWDMPAGDVKKVLQVFRGPSNADERSMWDDQPMRIELGKSAVTFTEVGSIVDGQSLKVARIVQAGDDHYPDVPRELVAVVDMVALEPVDVVQVNADALARFVAAAKAYSGEVPVMAVAAGFGLHRALVRVGRSFLGTVPAHPNSRLIPERLAEQERQNRGWWTEQLAPLRRPEPVRVSAAQTDDLTEQAAQVLHDAGPDVGLRVVPDRPDRDA